MTIRRNRTKQTIALEERLAAEARKLRKKAGQLPPGVARERLLRKARQDETAANLSAWISSAGLRPPD